MRAFRPQLVYAALALVVAGPLLAPGLILVVDLSVVPHPSLPSMYWGLPTGTHGAAASRLPFDLLFVLAGHVGAVGLLEKILLLALLFLAGFGMHRLVPARHEIGRYFAGFFYAVNPFVYDRLDSGQWFLLLGYALLPWAFAAFLPVAQGDRRAAWRFALLATLVGAASPHMFALLLVLTTLHALFNIRGLRATGIAYALTVAASLYWLLPHTGVSDLWRHVTKAQLTLYATVGDHRWGLLANVLGLYGYWNDSQPVKTFVGLWPLGTLALIALAALGAGYARRSSATWTVVAAATFGALFALGTRGALTGGLFQALLDHVAAARSFREPQKAVALLVFGYAFLGGIGVAELRLRAALRRQAGVLLVSAAIVSLPFLYAYRELGGLWGTLHPSAYPADWEQAREVLGRDAKSSNTLFLPWHGYFALSFAHDRVVANPAASFFDTPVIASRSVGEGSASDNSDPRDAAITRLLAAGPRLTTLGACLAPFGISHILVANEADSRRFGFLAQQKDLVVERRWAGLTLYRSSEPTGLVLAVSNTSANPCRLHVRPVAVTQHSATRIVLAAPPRSGEVLLLAASAQSAWQLGGRAGGRVAATGEPRFEAAAGTGRSIELTTAIQNEHRYAAGFLALVLVALGAAVARRREPPRNAAPVPDDWAPRVCVVLPTYNEAENVESMLGELGRSLTDAGINGLILVVDDASPDGTGALAEAIAATNPHIMVLHRSAKAGLGPAYVAGFRHALAAGAELIVQMDCDFSHDPEDVPRLVGAARQADVVLGSRYVDGGAVTDWGPLRRVVSRCGSVYARLVLGLPYADLTGGFKCFRRTALSSLDLDALGASGYAFQIETTYRADRLGLTIAEIPIVFRNRTVGSSKMTASIALEALLLVPWLRFRGGSSASEAKRQAATAAL
jgi:dolichol-phosphate mannosyltransferase